MLFLQRHPVLPTSFILTQGIGSVKWPPEIECRLTGRQRRPGKDKSNNSKKFHKQVPAAP
jgi:hypothetical protein